MSEAGPVSPERLRPSRRLAFGIVVLCLTAVITRFWDLGDRPLHHDESIHAYQSYVLSKGTSEWRYDPAYHGPFLYYVNALVYKIFGATNTTARLMPAIFGLILIGFAWPLRRWIGKEAAFAYAIFVLTSGHFSYFSRFIREDLYSLVFTLGTILAFQRFLETDLARWLTISATSFALAGVTKENAYMTGILFVAYGLWRLLARAIATKPHMRSLAAGIRDSAKWAQSRLIPILSAGILFMVIWVTLYTSFGKYPGDWLAIPKAVKYWMGQHTIARIPGPWWYYIPQLAYYETAIGIAACAALLRADFRRDPLVRAALSTGATVIVYWLLGLVVPSLPALPLRGVALVAAAALAVSIWRSRGSPSPLPLFIQFIAFWGIGSLLIYAWAREKVPWLTVHPLLPITILGAIGAASLWETRGSIGSRVALGAIGFLLVVNTGGMILANFRYGAHDKEREPKHAEMLAYVQTTRDLIRALEVIPQAKTRVAPGQNVITVAGEAGWPLTWYLRDTPTSWASRIENASTPVIVADWDPEGTLEKQLASKYDAKRVPIRAWWFPETQREGEKIRPTAGDFLHWWLFHEIWSPIGSQDATIYVRKDLGGTGILEPLELSIKDTSARDYPTEGLELPAARAWGSPGVGPGQFNEPRGIAADSKGSLYVADTKNSRIEVFDGNGGFLRAFGTRGAGDGQLNEPCGLAVGPDGEVYVADTWNHRVVRFGSAGEFHGAWSEPERGFFGPRAVVLSRGSLYVADTGNKRIVRFDAGGKVTGSWGSAGADPGQFVEPVGLAADASGRIYVADTGNHRVQVFEADGAFVRQFPVYGWKDFYTEPYIAVGPSESVFVTDSWKGRIAHYDVSGTLIRSFKAAGMKRPTGIALDSFGRLTVSDRETNRLLYWSLSDFLRGK
ncbi:MAG TPA: flippase activity-associated protein Agl23 [Thermoanaerobaculia bacterium]